MTPFACKLLDWYAKNARVLPWRLEDSQQNGYTVWVSEIMLQQTRVETVIPYFQKWLARFSTVFELAAAPQQDVLNLWEGLGYYSRARNLHKAAKMVVDEFEGNIPRDAKTLISLPGIGRYTAGAIASIAFGEDEAALDGNIRRVLSRFFNVEEIARSTKGERRLWELAEENLPPGRAGDYNQAIMDLGATICLPKNPNCDRCPLNEICEARALGVQEQRPIPKPKTKIPHVIVTAAVIHKDARFLIVQRPPDGLLGGMWEFPGGKQKPGEDLHTCLKREICEELNTEIQIGEPFGVYNHAYTHFKVTLHAFLCTMNGNAPQLNVHTDLCWVNASQLDEFPMGKIDRMIANNLQERA